MEGSSSEAKAKLATFSSSDSHTPTAAASRGPEGKGRDSLDRGCWGWLHPANAPRTAMNLPCRTLARGTRMTLLNNPSWTTSKGRRADVAPHGDTGSSKVAADKCAPQQVRKCASAKKESSGLA